ncbi:hypothetical protein [Alkalihalobacterium alkalinitrilicum]|uniref:hypothetical protein n=1 Tax=Alkalihalobacterium alkalinitrilicum TaxID=427920 RepID=UPI000995C19A|nr:hypothetical protein [Alkalihalobacterium alkalinitrilicum]
MNVQITSVNMRYSDGKMTSVDIHFNGIDEQRTVHLNGYIPLTAEEYSGNESLTALTNIVREQLVNRLLEEESE